MGIRLDENGTSLGGHAVTLWGYKTIDGSLDGIWISDSDNTDNNIDYYTIYYTELYFPRWHIQNDYGNPNEYKYIGSLAGLLPNSNVNPDPNGGENGVVPEPGTILLLGFGLLGIAGVSRKKTILL